MKLKFVTPSQARKDQHRLKEKIEKERNINSRKKGNWRKRNGRKDKNDGKESREIRCLVEGHTCLVAFVYERDNNVVSQRLVEKVQLSRSFHPNQARIKFSTGNVWKKYYVILLRQTLVVFFLEGHDFILKRSILINVPFIWGMRDMKWSWNLWHQDKPIRINIGWRRQ